MNISIEAFTRRFSWNALSWYSFRVSWQGYFSYEGNRRNIKTSGDIHTESNSRYMYRDTRISVWKQPNGLATVPQWFSPSTRWLLLTRIDTHRYIRFLHLYIYRDTFHCEIVCFSSLYVFFLAIHYRTKFLINILHCM